LRIHLHEQTPSEQLDSLELGSIDVRFTRPLPKAKAARFVQKRVYRDCVVAVLVGKHLGTVTSVLSGIAESVRSIASIASLAETLKTAVGGLF
jgi:hypothetical protein